MSTITILIGVFFANWAISSLFVTLIAKWLRIPKVSFARALFVTLTAGILSMLVQWGLNSLWTVTATPYALELAVNLAGSLLAQWLIFKRLLDTSLMRAIGAWLGMLAQAAVGIAFVFLVLKPYILEAFIVSNHAMAPTLFGLHQSGVCPRCGHVATVSYDANLRGFSKAERLGICESCQQAGMIRQINPTIEPPDRFMVNKTLTPRRWDLITYRSLDDPSALQVKRLIGLPGEQVVIKDGSIWINESKKEPPAEIAQLTFAATPEVWDPGAKVQTEHATRLGPDEYFVIGDFSLRSLDSRSWGPLPGRNVTGVVTLIYWPTSRWHIFR